MTIPPTLYHRLRTTLLRCGPFNSDRELQAVFVDARISQWAADLPEAGSEARITTTMKEHLSRFIWRRYQWRNPTDK